MAPLNIGFLLHETLLFFFVVIPVGLAILGISAVLAALFTFGVVFWLVTLFPVMLFWQLEQIDRALAIYIQELEHIRENLRTRQLQEEFHRAATFAGRLRGTV